MALRGADYARLKAHVVSEATKQAQADMEYFHANNLVPTEALVQQLAERRAKLAWGKIEAGLEERMNAGMTIDEAINDYLATVENTQRKDKAMPPAADPQTPQRRRPSMRQLYGTFSASPIIFLVLGAVCGLLAIAGLCVEIRTSELLVYKSADPTIMYVLYQPYYLVMGGQSLIEKMSWFYGYGVETVDLVFAFVLNHVTHALRQTNPKIAKFFGIASLILVALNCWSNVNSLPGLDPLIQALVGLLLACAVVVFPVASLALIERGLAELGDD